MQLSKLFSLCLFSKKSKTDGFIVVHLFALVQLVGMNEFYYLFPIFNQTGLDTWNYTTEKFHTSWLIKRFVMVERGRQTGRQTYTKIEGEWERDRERDTERKVRREPEKEVRERKK